MAESAGYDLDEIKQKVGEVTDRYEQKFLLDRRGNNTLVNSVLDKHHGNEKLICKSDDFLFIFDCKLQQTSKWFINHRKAVWSQEDVDVAARCTVTGTWRKRNN